MGADKIALTYYQDAFLKDVIRLQVPLNHHRRQRTAYHHDTKSNDFDLWILADPLEGSVVQRCLKEWAAWYPIRTALLISGDFILTEKTQVSFPDADVAVLDDDGFVHRSADQSTHRYPLRSARLFISGRPRQTAKVFAAGRRIAHSIP